MYSTKLPIRNYIENLKKTITED